MKPPNETGSEAGNSGADIATAPSVITRRAVVNEITRLHCEVVETARTTFDKAIRIGELLAQVKSELKHGEWLPWIERNFSFTERTARNYMRVYENRDRLKSETVSDLGDAYRLLAEQRDAPTFPTKTVSYESWLDQPISEQAFLSLAAEQDEPAKPSDDYDLIWTCVVFLAWRYGRTVTPREILEIRAWADEQRKNEAARITTLP